MMQTGHRENWISVCHNKPLVYTAYCLCRSVSEDSSWIIVVVETCAGNSNKCINEAYLFNITAYGMETRVA